MDPEVLFHFTKDPEAIASILSKRFEFQFAPRRLIYDLVPSFPRDIAEPQAFGTISLSENNGEVVRSRFGQYGIAVRSDWARAKKAQRVLYVDPDSALGFALKREFQAAFEEMKTAVNTKYPDDDLQRWAFWNRNVAWTIGAHRWDRALAQFEFMQHVMHADEEEWRIINPYPMAMGGEKGHAARRAANPYGQFVNQNHVKPNDVAYLICPTGQRNSFVERLPPDFSKLEVHVIE